VCSQVFDHTSVIAAPRKRVESHSRGSRFGKPTSAPGVARCAATLQRVQPAWRGSPAAFYASSGHRAGIEFTRRIQSVIHREISKFEAADIEPIPGAVFTRSAPLPLSVQFHALLRAWTPRQEKGVRPSLPLPYELYASGTLSAGRKFLEIAMEARNEAFGPVSAGSPFMCTPPGKFTSKVHLRTRAYAVGSGKRLTDTWELSDSRTPAPASTICASADRTASS